MPVIRMSCCTEARVYPGHPFLMVIKVQTGETKADASRMTFGRWKGKPSIQSEWLTSI